METTFDKFITNDSKQKALFDKEYAEFSNSERALGNLSKERLNTRFKSGKMLRKASCSA